MIMWMLLMGLLLLGSLSGIYYLATRVSRFKVIRQLSRGKKAVGKWIGLGCMALLFGGIWLAWGYMNAIVCVMHLLIFWLLFEGLFNGIAYLRKRPFSRYYAGAAAIVFTVCYLAAGWYSAFHVRQTSYSLSTGKPVGELRIAVLSDSHVGTTFHGDGFAAHLQEIQAQQPDLLLIVGDFVDDDTTEADMRACCQALGKMETTYGVYYVFGNHDKGYYDYRGYTGEDLAQELETNGVTVLEDDVVLIDDRFYLIGRADKSEEHAAGRKTMAALTQGLDSYKFTVVLDHQPMDYAAQAAAGVDLVLSGHTHGGQFIPMTTISKLFGPIGNDWIYGYTRRDNTNFIVTSGISDWAIKFKTGCWSEYILIDIQSE